MDCYGRFGAQNSGTKRLNCFGAVIMIVAYVFLVPLFKFVGMVEIFQAVNQTLEIIE